MKQWQKNFLYIIGGLVTGSYLFDRYYRRQFDFVKHEEFETVIDPDDTKLPWIHWVSELNYGKEMTEVVIPAIYQDYRVYHHRHKAIDFTIQHFVPDSDQPDATILILHGFKEFKEVYSEVIYYLLQLNYEVFIYDHRGHGESNVPADSDIEINDFELYTEDALAIIQNVILPHQLAKAIIVLGHSMGGLVSLNLVEQAPYLFNGAILNSPELMLNTGNLPVSFANLIVAVLDQFDFGADLFLTEETLNDPRLRYLLKDLILSRSDYRREYLYALGSELYDHVSQAGGIQWIHQSFKAMMRIVNPENLEKVTRPVALIRAENDDLVQSAGLYTATHYLSNAHLYCVPGGRHENLLDKDAPLYALIACIHEEIQDMLI
ncbi:alpha/beta fold hydrolase [Aerococcaceae bacterium DSM 111020]|nr:alpha/beta fold hydrolase [Aerococcaceae bacterium DSM 111020]